MGRGFKEERSSAAASGAQRLKKTVHSSSGFAVPFTSSMLSSSAGIASSTCPLQIVREVKRLWESCTLAATPEKLLRASERLFEILSGTLEQRGLVYPVETIICRAAAPGTAAGGQARAAADSPLPDRDQRNHAESLSSNGGSISRDSDVDGDTQEEKFRGWLRAAAEQFLVLLCELIDSDAEVLQRAGLGFCMRIVAHTHRVRAASRSMAGEQERGRDGGTARGGRGFDKPLMFPLSAYQLLVSRLLHARHFAAAALAKHLILQVVPHPDLRFYFLVVLRKILEEEHHRQQQEQHQQQQQQKQRQQQAQHQQQQPEQQEGVGLRQWFKWPAGVSAAAAAERVYMVLAGLPVPQPKKSGSPRSSRRNEEGNSGSNHGEGVDEAECSSTSAEGSSSDEETSSSDEETSSITSSQGSGSSNSSSSDSGAEERERSHRRKKRESRARGFEESRLNASCDYTIKSCYLLRINTRRCCDASEYRRVYERVWLLFLRCSAGVWSIAQVQGKRLLHHLLLSLPRVLLPHMSNPLLLADFFLQAFDTRGDGAAVLEGNNREDRTANQSSIKSSSSSSPLSSDSSVSVLAGNQTYGSLSARDNASEPSPCFSAVTRAGCLASEYEARTQSGVSTSFSEEAVLALSGLFYLLTQHGLGDPDTLLLEGNDAVQQQEEKSRFSDEGEDSFCSSSDSEETAPAAAQRNSDKGVTCHSAGSSTVSSTMQKREGKADFLATVNGSTISGSPATATTQVHNGIANTSEARPAKAVGVSSVDGATNGTAAASDGAAASETAVIDAGATSGAAAAAASASAAVSDAASVLVKSRRGRTAGAGRVDVHLYGRLYALLTPAAFAVKGKARRRFLRLLSLALRSPLLPTHLVSSFLKKSCRVACLVSPGGALYLAGLVFVLLKRHAAVCSSLIDVPPALAQELVVEGGDHFHYNTLSLLQHRPRNDQECHNSESEYRDSHSGRQEEEKRGAKRLKSISAGQEVARFSDTASAVDERVRDERSSVRDMKKQVLGDVKDRDTKRCKPQIHKEQEERFDESERADEQESSTLTQCDAAPRADIENPACRTRKNLFELILECSPRKSDFQICEAEGRTAACVKHGVLLATENVKQQAQTSLWELELLRLHYDPAVRQFVSLFDVAFSTSGSSGKSARAAATIATTLDPDDYYWRLDWDALMHHEFKVAAKRSRTGVAPIANRAKLPLADVVQLARAAVIW